MALNLVPEKVEFFIIWGIWLVSDTEELKEKRTKSVRSGWNSDQLWHTITQNFKGVQDPFLF